MAGVCPFLVVIEIQICAIRDIKRADIVRKETIPIKVTHVEQDSVLLSDFCVFVEFFIRQITYGNGFWSIHVTK